MARIVLINPRFPTTYWGVEYAMPMLYYKAAMPPANLALLGALTPKEHTVTVFDENIEPLDYDRCAQADIIGVTGMMIQVKRIREILTEFKRRGQFVVVGGPCVTTAPEQAEGIADVVFLGEAEQTWPQFLTDWSRGEHRSRYEQEQKTDMTTVPPPRFKLLKMRKYLFGSVQISRGCPFLCEFCDIIVVLGRRPRLKTASQVIAELEANYAAGKELVFIVDDNLIGNKKAIKPILREIISWQKAKGYPLVLVTEASIDLAEDDEMLRLMYEANFEAVFVGIESTNEDVLRETKKIQNLTDSRGTMLEKVHRIQDAGLEVLCGMIVGFDNDNDKVFADHRQFVQRSRVVLAIVNILTALPKTPLYDRLMHEGRIDNSGDVEGFSMRTTNIIPNQMSRRTLADGFIQLLRDLYAPAAYFARMDALYSNYMPSANRWKYLRDHPWRRFKTECRYFVEALYIFVQLMRLVSIESLRTEYQRRIWNVLRQRRSLTLFRAYCFKSALHFHYHMFIEKMASDRAAMVPEIDNIAGSAGELETSGTLARETAAVRVA
jgi:radical SAM superfamily enzyme YgiQ (UPF0313 family)